MADYDIFNSLNNKQSKTTIKMQSRVESLTSLSVAMPNKKLILLVEVF